MIINTHRLLAEKALTFAKAQEIAEAMELADKDVQSLRSNSHSPVHKLNKPQQRNTNSNTTHMLCYRCGGKHSAAKCRFKTEQCHVCGKVGHISRVCRK